MNISGYPGISTSGSGYQVVRISGECRRGIVLPEILISGYPLTWYPGTLIYNPFVKGRIMDEQSVEGSESVVDRQAEPEVAGQLSGPAEPRDSKSNRKIMLWGGAALAVLLIGAGLIYYLLPKIRAVGWFSNQMIAVYIAIGAAGAVVVAGLLFRNSMRTRLKMERVIRDDTDINDWLVVFSWTPKILYAPTIIASFIAALVCYFWADRPIIGGVWAAIFFLNFLVEEYNISIKILLIAVIGVGFFFLWLHLLGWVMPFLRLFRRVAISMNPTVYLLVGLVGLFAIFVSWLRGLFYYVSITPNYMNIQEGPSETGEQISREDYNSRVDTSDFLERLMGFGRIVITFREDRKRDPIVILVWRIQKKAELLERVRAKFAIDHQVPLQPPKL
jgi:MFS family permease